MSRTNTGIRLKRCVKSKALLFLRKNKGANTLLNITEISLHTLHRYDDIGH